MYASSAGVQDLAGARVVQPLLGERVADTLDDPALDLAGRAERVDHASDVVDGGDPLDPDLAGLDVDRDLRHLDAEGQHLHARRIRAARAAAEDLCVFEQRDDLGERHVPGRRAVRRSRRSALSRRRQPRERPAPSTASSRSRR